jgi:hypothetical protein
MMARIVNLGGLDTASLHFDGVESLLTRKISPNYNISDFIDHLEGVGESDLALVLLEIEDKADSISSLSDDTILDFSNASYFFTQLGYTGSIDYIALAVHIDGVLFGVESQSCWASHEVEFSIYPSQHNNARPSIIYTISSQQSGIRLRSHYDLLGSIIPLEDLLPNCRITDNFRDWLGELTNENESIVRKKLKLAHERGFQGGKPLFDTLDDGDGMREVRFNAYGGGAIRILFAALPNEIFALLVGFIKKSDNEGYTENIKIGKTLWKQLL